LLPADAIRLADPNLVFKKLFVFESTVRSAVEAEERTDLHRRPPCLNAAF
jgi:hypothetical protein